MNKYPVKLAKRALRKVDNDEVVVEPASGGNPFFSFRYSYTEISALGRTAHVKSRKARYEDGKLTSEAFEGELDRSVYERMVSEAQNYFLGQAALFFQSFSSFLPSSRNRDSGRG
jgi:hypothetical protein